MKKTCLFVFFLCLVFVATTKHAKIYAESFRVSSVFPVVFADGNYEEKSLTTGINDSIAIFLPEDTTYFEGVNVHIKIPDAVAQWRDSVICSVYEAISPKPDAQQIDYSGNRAATSVLPMRTSWEIQIPIKENNSIRETRFAEKLDFVPDISAGFVFLRIQPAMKGIPNETLESKLQITVRPILLNKGRLEISVAADKPYTIFFDDKQVSEDLSGSFVEAGKHTLSVVSEHYRNEIRTVFVEQGKTVSVDFEMRSIEPTLFVTAPENAVVYLDDEIFTDLGREVPTTPGDHKIRFRTASYEVTKQISIQNGKTYSLSLFMDIAVTEE